MLRAKHCTLFWPTVNDKEYYLEKLFTAVLYEWA
jgi:hypothetical protein